MIRRSPVSALSAITAFACLLILGSGCMRLDMFLFNGKPAPDDLDLMEAATEIPEELREELFIEAEDGTEVNAYFLRHEAGDGTDEARHDTAILYCHGNKLHIQEYALRVQELWKLGYTVLIFDYRGYGKTKGKTTEEGAYMDARAARAFLETEIDPARIGLYGYSLGTAVCTKLASEEPAPALALEAPFGSVKAMANGSLGLEAPGDWFADSTMNTLERITDHEGALLVMHGTQDDFVKPDYGQAIYEASEAHASSRELWLVDGATHSNVPCNPHDGVPPQGGCSGGFSDEYLSRVSTLFDAALGVER